MSLSLRDNARRLIRWSPAAILCIAAPKCVVCVAAYLGLGAALAKMIGGAELCGATESPGPQVLAWLLAAGGAVGLVTLGCLISKHRRRSSRSIT